MSATKSENLVHVKQYENFLHIQTAFVYCKLCNAHSIYLHKFNSIRSYLEVHARIYKMFIRTIPIMHIYAYTTTTTNIDALKVSVDHVSHFHVLEVLGSSSQMTIRNLITVLTRTVLSCNKQTYT